jgi:hypothetical protein
VPAHDQRNNAHIKCSLYIHHFHHHRKTSALHSPPQKTIRSPQQEKKGQLSPPLTLKVPMPRTAVPTHPTSRHSTLKKPILDQKVPLYLELCLKPPTDLIPLCFSVRVCHSAGTLHQNKDQDARPVIPPLTRQHEFHCSLSHHVASLTPHAGQHLDSCCPIRRVTEQHDESILLLIFSMLLCYPPCGTPSESVENKFYFNTSSCCPTRG